MNKSTIKHFLILITLIGFISYSTIPLFAQDTDTIILNSHKSIIHINK